MNLAGFEDNLSSLKAVLRDIERRHEVYYITDRIGIDVKRQTKMWLIEHLNYLGRAHTEPTVLITKGSKGPIVRGLALDAYIDDKFENVRDVVADSPTTRMYYLHKRYNEKHDVPGAWRVSSLASMLDAEIAAENL